MTPVSGEGSGRRSPAEGGRSPDAVCAAVECTPGRRGCPNISDNGASGSLTERPQLSRALGRLEFGDDLPGESLIACDGAEGGLDCSGERFSPADPGTPARRCRADFFLNTMQAVVLAYHMTATSTSSSGADSDDPDAQSERPHLAKGESDGLVRARRGEKIQKILEDAKGRDDEATARDAVADERDRVADLKAFTDPNGAYPGQSARRAAARDRADSKSDRESAAEDRIHLTEDDQ